MRSVLLLLGLALLTGRAAAQDTASVSYKGVSCTPRQRSTRTDARLVRQRAPRNEWHPRDFPGNGKGNQNGQTAND